MKRVGIIGYGAIGPIHARAINKAPDAVLYAVCDIDKKMLQKCRECYDVKTFENYEAMLEDKSIDSVHICTPHYLHFEMIKKSLEAGKTVVAEKPVTMKSEEYKKLLSMNQSSNVCLVLQNRYNPCVKKMKEMIDGGVYGKITAVKAVLTWHRTPEYYKGATWRGKWATEGGGVLINQAVHTLDLMSYLGGEISSVSANMFNYSLRGSIEVEDTFTGYMKYKDGHRGIFFATNAYSQNSNPELEIVFEHGTLKYEYGKLYDGNKFICEDADPAYGKSYWGAGHENLISDFYSKNKYISLSDARNTMECLFAMYESARSEGMEIKIDG